MALKIDEIFAFVAVDKDGDEVIMAGFFGDMEMVMPLIGADMARVDSLRPIAELTGKMAGVEVKLIRFTNRIEET